MKKGYKVVRGESRKHLEKQVNAILADTPHQIELGQLVIVGAENRRTFYQSFVRTILDESDFPGFDKADGSKEV